MRRGAVRRQAPSADPSAPVADGALTRYFVGQLSSRAVFNPQFEIRAFLPALGLLLRQYPMILLFARAACYARGGEELTPGTILLATKESSNENTRSGAMAIGVPDEVPESEKENEE